MAEHLSKKPRKGILKPSSSFDETDPNKQKDIKWDEMNILQTLHPPDKDYGLMKIEEPKTPYNFDHTVTDESEGGSLDATLLAEKITLSTNEPPRAMADDDQEEEESDEYEEETEEERAKRKAFEYKRKMHYNEFYAVKLARTLMSQDDDEGEENNDIVHAETAGQEGSKDEDEVFQG